MKSVTVGVLAVQGAFQEHIELIKSLQHSSVQAIPVRTKADLAKVDGLIIPGGESTSMGIICDSEVGFMDKLKEFRCTKPVWVF